MEKLTMYRLVELFFCTKWDDHMCEVVNGLCDFMETYPSHPLSGMIEDYFKDGYLNPVSGDPKRNAIMVYHILTWMTEEGI